MLSLLFVIPHGLDSKASKDFAKFEFSEYAIFNITQEGIKESLFAKKGYHYDNKEILEHITYTKEINNISTHIKAKTALYQDNIIEFSQDVALEQDNQFKLTANHIIYDLKNNFIYSHNPFLMTQSNGYLSGRNFTYNLSDKIFISEKSFAHYTFY
jgi:LPS export ABC transporter protein LptC